MAAGRRMCLSIAGLTVALEMPAGGWYDALLPRFGKFRVADDARGDLVCLTVVDPDLTRLPGGEPRVEQEDDGLHLRHDNFDSHLPPGGPSRITIYQQATDEADVLYTMVVDSLLRMQLAQALAERGGLMLHAAGIAVDEQAGYVFFGPSGSGKTTVCQLSHPKYRILCDEVIAVRPTPVGDRLYGTPFNGAWGDSLPEDVPLRELFLLHQDTVNRRVALEAPSAVHALLESALVYHREPGMIGRMLDVVLGLLQRTPVSRLDFLKKETLWQTVLAPTV